MSGKIIKKRDQIIEIGKTNLSILTNELDTHIRNRESEALFSLVHIFPNLFSELAIGKKLSPILNQDWLRAVTGFTLALNNILPNHLPLKPIEYLDNDKLEYIIDNELRPIIEICITIGRWQHIIDNKYVKRIKVENHRPYPTDNEKLPVNCQKYIDQTATNIEYFSFIESFYKDLSNHPEFLQKIDQNLLNYHNFSLEDLIEASKFLEGMVLNGNFKVNKNQLHAVFTRAIRNHSANKLFNSLLFGIENNNLFKSPLIPLKNNGILIAGWILKMQFHFESWIRPIIEREKIQSHYNSLMGFFFEKYVYKMITQLVDYIEPQLIFSIDDYPSIKEALIELNKKNNFEIDIFAIKSNTIYLISCKGGKKELPKLNTCKYWATFPTIEIKNKIDDNIKYIYEIGKEAECINKLSSIRIKNCDQLKISNFNIIPVLLYSTFQPLSYDEIKEAIKSRIQYPNVIVTTPQRLVKRISNHNEI